MAATAQSAIAVIGIDIGKNSFHVVGLDGRGAIVLRQKWSRGQVETRFANMWAWRPASRFAYRPLPLSPKSGHSASARFMSTRPN
jgi:hypothetical protein